MKKAGIEIYVTGIVQGVGFRYFTQLQASLYHLCGTVENLSDGRVKIRAFGDEENLRKLVHWLELGGPKSAKITSFDTHSIAYEEGRKFSISY